MATLHSKLAQALAVIPVILLVTLVNVVIASTLAGITFIQLIAVLGWSKGASLVVAILVAIAVHTYIACQPKIRNYISVRSKYE
jgi:ABC-type dipeptide/oligopeptide/nickel transport system permease subunit